MSIRKTQTGRKSLLAGASVLAAATAMFTGGVTVAHAQEAEEDEAIVVTGTRIARRDAVAESPILTVGQEEMTQSGFVTVEQYLNTLPQVTAGISSQSNNPSSNGRAFIDLRGLGSARNLVLIDGRRPMGSTGGGVVDVNTIPAALIERAEIITGGAASTYGADAVAGVVNFILRDNFEGFAWDTQYRITEAGDGEEWGTDFTFGGNFADGRGNAVFNASYFNRDVIMKSARDFSAQASASTDTFPGGAAVVAANAPSQVAVDAVFGAGNCINTGGGSGFGFNPDGTLFCTGVGGGSPFNIFGFTGPQSYIATRFAPDFFSYNFEPENILVLPLERWSFFTKMNLDLNDSFRPYIQAMFTNYNADQQLAATPASPGSLTGWNVPRANAFIVPGSDFDDILASRGNPNGTFAFSKRFSDLGGRRGSNNHDVWQMVLGTEGDLTDTWSYDIHASYGRSLMTEVQSGNVRRDRVGLLLGDDAFYTPGTVGDAPTIAQQNTLSGGNCPNGLNLFGNAPLDASCARWISLEAKNTTLIVQNAVEGTVTGELFQLPAGAVQIAVGAGYRDIELTFRPDGGLQPGLVAGFNQQLPVNGQLDWFDIFGEIYVPILSNLPGVESLSLTGGYRTSDNNLSGVSESWKINGDWTVTDWLRFRGGVQTAVRAPSINELFAPQLNNFPAFTGQDPCDTSLAPAIWNRQGANGANVTALCLAQSPVAAGPGFVWNGQANGITGGNPNLEPETADSYTVGFVLNSPFNTGGFLDSLYLSVDYWSIEMENVIAAVGAATIVQRCFGRDGANGPGVLNPNNFWCNLFSRSQDNGQVIQLLQNAQNQAFQNTSGVDIVAGIGFDLGGAGSLDFNLLSTWVERFETQTSTADPMNDYVGTIGTGTGSATPEWRHTFTTTWSSGPVALVGTARYIDGMVHAATVTGGSPVTNTGTDEVWYFDLRGSFDLTSNLTLRAGVNNVGDTEPELYTPNIQSNTDPSTYDVLGRRFFVGFNLRM